MRTFYVAGDKICCGRETDEVATIIEHARSGGFPADLVAEVVEQIGPHFPAHTMRPEANGSGADQPYMVQDGA